VPTFSPKPFLSMTTIPTRYNGWPVLWMGTGCFLIYLVAMFNSPDLPPFLSGNVATYSGVSVLFTRSSYCPPLLFIPPQSPLCTFLSIFFFYLWQKALVCALYLKAFLHLLTVSSRFDTTVFFPHLLKVN